MEKVHISLLLLLTLLIASFTLTTSTNPQTSNLKNQNAKTVKKGENNPTSIPDPYASAKGFEDMEIGEYDDNKVFYGGPANGYFGYPYPGGFFGPPRGIFRFPRGLFPFPRGHFGFPLNTFGEFPSGYGVYPRGYGGSPGRDGGYGGGGGGPGGKAKVKGKEVNPRH